MLLNTFHKSQQHANYLFRHRDNFAAARKHGRDLLLLNDNTGLLQPNALVAFVVCRNECFRLPFFLEYYRNYGIDHFCFVDNDSNDGTRTYLCAQPDCTLWTTTSSYRDSHYGVHWLNYLLKRYGTGHWCLTVDPDEFLCAPYHGSRNLKELCAYLDSKRKQSFFTTMLDMYPRGSIQSAVYEQGQNPLEVANWFDPTGYHQVQSHRKDWWIRGGVRRRVFFADSPEYSPALNKTPLVKWSKHFLYIMSTHTLAPDRINEPHFSQSLAPTGCLLHFKYLSTFIEKVREEEHRRQHYAGSLEYSQYNAGLQKDTILWCNGSVQFTEWQQLVELGLMGTGGWF
jgi:hypothetical protein